MRVLNLEEKNTAHMEAINKFTLMDDTFMTQVFSGDLECIRDFAFKKKMPVLPRVYAENRKEPYGIKSYSFFMHKQSKRTPFVV